MKISIVIPAYNEDRVIGQVIQDVRDAGYGHIIVIDDGSKDETASCAREAGVLVFRHRLNRGKGAAAKTGIEAALREGADIVVTMDGDGQHEARDITNLVTPIQEGKCEVVLGVRPLTDPEMPSSRMLLNTVGNMVTKIMSGIQVRDSQSGFRAFSRKALELIDTVADQYEYETEVIREIARHKLRFEEVPIMVRYTEYSLGKGHGQGVMNGIRTVYRMMWNSLS